VILKILQVLESDSLLQVGSLDILFSIICVVQPGRSILIFFKFAAYKDPPNVVMIVKQMQGVQQTNHLEHVTLYTFMML
jgi:hypothetical protein